MIDFNLFIQRLTELTARIKLEKETQNMANATAEKKDITVQRTGDVLIIPENIDYATAMQTLQRRHEEEMQDIQVKHDFLLTPPEGSIAFLKTLREIYGFVNPTSTPGFFGPKPPQFMAVEVGPGKTEMIPLGRLRLPNVTGWVEPSYEFVDGTPRFMFHGVVKGKDKNAIQAIADRMRELVKGDSLYRGHAVRVPFPSLDDATSLTDFFPRFMDVSGVDVDSLIFPENIGELVDVTLFTPIEHTAVCREQKIPLKRGILLEGPYGVGKTLTATVTAKKCTENGWTFIYLEDVSQLREALAFARQYQPAVIFAEDIDQVLKSPDGRDSGVNEILNSIDGLESKGVEVITVLTTNNVDNITQAMLRPGRLDTVVPVRAPDAKAAIRLVELFAGTRMEPNQDLTQVGDLLSGKIPAVIREVVERSKLSAVRRSKASGELKINARDIELAAIGMDEHLRLLTPKATDIRPDIVKAADALGTKIADALRPALPASTNGKSSNGAGTVINTSAVSSSHSSAE
jgi:transitional endoplasmic reticulum ATPase